ncbi:MAG: hypothetical protein ACRD6W_13000, partial [Nitrososphaerales archaeon]
MLITNNTNVPYWFGPMYLPPGSGSTLMIDDTSDTGLYLIDDEVAEAVNTLALASPALITVTPGSNSPYPRPTGTPTVLHGNGSPNGLIYAPQGSLFLRRDSSAASNALYTKTTSIDLSTGWQSVTFPTPSGTSFPATPNDGDEYTYVADSTSGVFWRFSYYAAGSYWAFIGGPPLSAAHATVQGIQSSSYTTINPSITLPFSGDWDVEVEGQMYLNYNTMFAVFLAYSGAGITASDDDAAQLPSTLYATNATYYDPSGNGKGTFTLSAQRRKTGL